MVEKEEEKNMRKTRIGTENGKKGKGIGKKREQNYFSYGTNVLSRLSRMYHVNFGGMLWV